MKNKFVMIAEDDFAIREGIAELLDLEGYSYVKAENGQQAIDYLEKNPVLPGAMILDLMMPVCSGYEVLEFLKTDAKYDSLPVVIISAAADAAAAAKKYNTQFIRKPLDADALLDVIAKIN